MPTEELSIALRSTTAGLAPLLPDHSIIPLPRGATRYRTPRLEFPVPVCIVLNIRTMTPCMAMQRTKRHSMSRWQRSWLCPRVCSTSSSASLTSGRTSSSVLLHTREAPPAARLGATPPPPPPPPFPGRGVTKTRPAGAPPRARRQWPPCSAFVRAAALPARFRRRRPAALGPPPAPPACRRLRRRTRLSFTRRRACRRRRAS